jgi:hypothetical protein
MEAGWTPPETVVKDLVYDEIVLSRPTGRCTASQRVALHHRVRDGTTEVAADQLDLLRAPLRAAVAGQRRRVRVPAPTDREVRPEGLAVELDARLCARHARRRRRGPAARRRPADADPDRPAPPERAAALEPQVEGPAPLTRTSELLVHLLRPASSPRKASVRCQRAGSLGHRGSRARRSAIASGGGRSATNSLTGPRAPAGGRARAGAGGPGAPRAAATAGRVHHDRRDDAGQSGDDAAATMLLRGPNASPGADERRTERGPAEEDQDVEGHHPAAHLRSAAQLDDRVRVVVKVRTAMPVGTSSSAISS